MGDIKIDNIKNYKCFENIVAQWLHKEWGYNGNINYWNDWVKNSQDENSLFQTFVIVDDNKLVGTYGIMPIDLQSRQDLFPWVGNLYIDNKNSSKSLLYFLYLNKHLTLLAEKLNISKIYVYTPHKPIVFLKYGFTFIDKTVDIMGEKISLLYKEF
jgi:N-acetylglutamate synthase-like GNAT family acetyltransferase